MSQPSMAEQAASLLQALEQDHTLLQETSFSGRVAALDLIETHVFGD